MDLGEELRAELEEANGRIAHDDALGALEHESILLHDLSKFDEREDKHAVKLVRILEHGGIFSHGITDDLDKAARLITELESSAQRNRVDNKKLDALHTLMRDMLALFESEYRKAMELREELTQYLHHEREIMEMIQKLHVVQSRTGKMRTLLRGNAQHLATIIQGSLHHAQAVFEAVEDNLRTRWKNAMTTYMRTGLDIEHGKGTKEDILAFKSLLAEFRNLHRTAVTATQETILRLKEHKAFRHDATEVGHFLDFVHLQTARIAREQKH